MISRVQYFVPAVVIGLLLAIPGGVFSAVGQFINQALFAWAAFCALNQQPEPDPLTALIERLPAHMIAWSSVALGAMLLIGVPVLYAQQDWNWVAASMIVLLALIFLMVATRIWISLYLCFFDPAARHVSGGLKGAVAVAALAGRRSIRLSAGHASHTLEAYVPAIGLLILSVWGFVLQGVEAKFPQTTYWILNGVMLALVCPLIHLGLARSTMNKISIGDAISTQTRMKVDTDVPPDDEPEEPVEAPPPGSGMAQLACESAAAGDLTRVRELLNGQSPDIHFENKTPLMAAIDGASAGRMGVIDWLLDQGADLDMSDQDGNTALHHAVLKQDLTTLESLVSSGSDLEALNNEALTPLALSASLAAWPCLYRLVELGADIHSVQGQPALLAAAMPPSDDAAGVEYLMQQGADPNMPGKLNRTALMGAALKGYSQVAEALLSEGADIDAQDQFGNTALMEATRSGANNVLERFVFWNPDTEKRDKPGRTAVLVAVSSRRADAETIRLLLAMGADKKASNRDGRQAGELAAAAGRWWIAKALGLDADLPSDTFSQSEGDVAGQDADGPKVIDLAQFESEADEMWVKRQMESRSRVQLRSAQGSGSLHHEPTTLEQVSIPDEVAAPAEPELSEVVVSEPEPQPAKPAEEEPDLSFELTPLESDRILTTAEALVVVDGGEAPQEEDQQQESEQDEQPTAAEIGYRTLVQAARRGDIEQMQMILDNESDVPEWWLSSAFLNSVAEGHVIAPSWLLDHNLSANAVSESGQPLLTCVVQQAPPNPDILEVLIQHGARVDSDPEILHWLAGMADAQHDHSPANLDEDVEDRLVGIVRQVIESGSVPVNMTDDKGRTALHWAVVYRRVDFAELLLQHGADINAQDSDGVSPLLMMVKSGNQAQVRMLCKNGADAHLADSQGVSAMSLALKSEDKTLSKILMLAASKAETKVTPARSRSTPQDLIAAATEGNLGAVKRILASKVDVNVKDDQGCTAVLRAAGAGHPTVVASLAAANADLNARSNNGMTPLGAAVLAGQTDVVKLLVDRQVDVDQRQQYGLTALMLAAARWQSGMVEQLLRAGANVNAKDDSETSVLMAAAQNALLSKDLDAGKSVFSQLVDAGAELDAVNDEGQNALMLLLGVRARSVSRASVDVVLQLAEMLIDRGADLDVQDYTGWSALHAASAHGFVQPTKLLLEQGANRRLRDINGLSACDLAMDNAHDQLVDLFL